MKAHENNLLRSKGKVSRGEQKKVSVEKSFTMIMKDGVLTSSGPSLLRKELFGIQLIREVGLLN